MALARSFPPIVPLDPPTVFAADPLLAVQLQPRVKGPETPDQADGDPLASGEVDNQAMTRRTATSWISLVVISLLAVTGCAAGTPAADGRSSSSASTPGTPSASTPVQPSSDAAPSAPVTSAPPATDPITTPSASSAAADPAVAGKIVVIDPGHNGANAANPGIINQPVPNGNGGTKPCNTTGTTTNGGFPEHEFNWDVATHLSALLEQAGVTVVLTRPDNSGVGPCVNERAAIGNAANADAVVSIHADGASASSTGVYCITTPLNPGGSAVASQSSQLAKAVRDALSSGGPLPLANYAGSSGIDPTRTDLAGLNLSTRPTTLCELGNMRSSQDAAVQASSQGRAALAQSLATGILTYLAA